MLLAFLGGCTADGLDQNPETKDGYVNMNFTLTDIPYTTVETKAGGETAVGSLSLLTFDASGNFIERVDASSITTTSTDETTGSASGTASATISKDTKIIHVIANYDWSDNTVTLTKGASETTLIPQLESSAKYLAWGRVAVSSLSNVTVDMTRNYAKVTVESKASNFTVAGFALGNYVSKGKIATYGEGTAFADVVNAISPAANYESYLTNQTDADVNNTTPKYMSEYANPSGNQSFVIVKNSANKYFKIQFLDKDKKPYVIERNYIYKVIIKTFDSNVSGSASFADALKAAPSNNIYAEVLKESTTISDGTNTLVVTPLFNILTTTGTAYTATVTVNANYFLNSDKSSDYSAISIQKSSDPRGYLNTLPSTTTDGKINVVVNVPASISKLDSATFSVSAGALSRTVTIYISKQYLFTPTSGYTYSAIGDEGNLTFTIPSDFPANLYPIKCKIKAEDLNPDNTANNFQMLIEQEGGTYYYIYNATSAGTKTIKFKTTRSTVTNPTVSNDYFATATMNMTYDGPISLSGTAKYGATGSTSLSTFTGTVYYTIGSNTSTLSVTSGNYTEVAIAKSISDATAVTFSYTTGGITYTESTTVGKWKADTALKLTADIISGNSQFYSSGLYIYCYQDITWTSGTKSGTITPDYYKNGSYTIAAPALSDNDVVTFTYSNSFTTSMTFAQWKSNKNLYFYSSNISGNIQYRYARNDWRNVPKDAVVSCSSGTIKVTSNGVYSYTPPSEKLSGNVTVTYGSYTVSISYSNLLNGDDINVR